MMQRVQKLTRNWPNTARSLQGSGVKLKKRRFLKRSDTMLGSAELNR